MALDAFAETCRRVLKEVGVCYPGWFFDQRQARPDIACLQYFEIETARDWLQYSLLYVEVHLDQNGTEGTLSACTLRIGSGGGMGAAQSEVRIHDRSNDLVFETVDENHHLTGRCVVDRNSEGRISGFRSAKFELQLIHPGTKQATRTIKKSSARLESAVIEIPCPKCLGKGDFFDMAIPEESFKSGLTGYALFSENRVCSHSGCPLCGGSGISYEEWYIKEKGISTQGLAPLIKGRGRLAIGGWPGWLARQRSALHL